MDVTTCVCEVNLDRPCSIFRFADMFESPKKFGNNVNVHFSIFTGYTVIVFFDAIQGW